MRRHLCLLAVASLLSALAAVTGGAPPAGAAINGIDTFTGTGVGAPEGMTAGPDGNVWFATSIGHRVGKVTPAGVDTTFPMDTTLGLNDIVAGPDGNLWFALTASGA